jgi:hypothetical protein
VKIKIKNLGTKKLKAKTTATDRMAAARAARGKTAGKTKTKTKKRAAAGDGGMPDLKKLKDRHIKAINEAKKPGVRGLLSISKVQEYFRSLGLRAPKDDILTATTAELYTLFFRAAIRTIRNNRKTVRGFDIR